MCAKNNKLSFNSVLKIIKESLSLAELDQLHSMVEALKYDVLYDKKVLELFEENLTQNQNNPICPHCHQSLTTKAGFDSQGRQRYRCHNNECEYQTFTSSTNTLLHSTKKNTSTWVQFVLLDLKGYSLRKIANILSISYDTAFNWRHKIGFSLEKHMNLNKLKGTVYLDETLVKNVDKNIMLPHDKTKKKKRGMSKSKRNITCAIDEQQNFILQATDCGRVTSKSLIEIYQDKIDKKATLVTDSLRSYHQLVEALDVNWKKIPSGVKQIDQYTLEKVNQFHDRIKTYLSNYRGVSSKYLQGYLAVFNALYEFPKIDFFDQFKIVISILCPTRSELRVKHIRKCKSIYPLIIKKVLVD